MDVTNGQQARALVHAWRTETLGGRPTTQRQRLWIFQDAAACQRRRLAIMASYQTRYSAETIADDTEALAVLTEAIEQETRHA